MLNYTRLILFIAAFLLTQTIIYFGVEIFEGEPHNVERPLDRKIPVIHQFSYIYVTWFALIAVTPLLIAIHDLELFSLYMASMAACIILSAAIYLIYPTSFTRPPSKSAKLKIIYFFSFKQVNCAPSMHCSMSYIVILAACLCPGLALPIRILLIADGVLIPVSTLFTKQHVIIDVVTALPTAAVSWLIGFLLYQGHLLDGFMNFFR